MKSVCTSSANLFFFRRCSSKENSINRVKEEEEHQNVAEEVKEKNFMLEKELYKSIITQAKQINVQLVYGKNKCDFYICYNKFRSKSSAISSFDFCDIGVFIEGVDAFSDFLFLISSVSFYFIIQ